MELDIRPLTQDRIADLATLFEQGGDPKWCWCAWFRVRSRDWADPTADDNRARLTAAVPASGTARTPGLVAYEDRVAVGWVSVGPREDFERLVLLARPCADR